MRDVYPIILKNKYGIAFSSLQTKREADLSFFKKFVQITIYHIYRKNVYPIILKNKKMA
jgi:hypothetical protein